MGFLRRLGPPRHAADEVLEQELIGTGVPALNHPVEQSKDGDAVVVEGRPKQADEMFRKVKGALGRLAQRGIRHLPKLIVTRPICLGDTVADVMLDLGEPVHEGATGFQQQRAELRRDALDYVERRLCGLVAPSRRKLPQGRAAKARRKQILVVQPVLVGVVVRGTLEPLQRTHFAQVVEAPQLEVMHVDVVHLAPTDRIEERRDGAGPELVGKGMAPNRSIGLGELLPAVDVLIPGEFDAGDVARLQNVQLALGEGPFDVLRQSAIEVGHPQSERAEFDNILVSDREDVALRGRYLLFERPSGRAAIAHDPNLFGSEHLALDGQRLSVENELVGREDSGDHPLAEPPGGVDHNLVGPGRQRVAGEQHTRCLRLDHRLNYDGEERG